MEFKPKSNDDPDTINFNFSIQSNSSPSNAQSIADALETFGSILFDESAAYGHRFMSFEVDPLTTTSVSVAIARGSWRQLEEGQHSFSYEAELILDKSTDVYASDTDEEEVKQFFLNGLNNGGVDLGSLLGSWTAIAYIPVATDAVEVPEKETATTQPIIPVAVPEVTTAVPALPKPVPALPNASAATVTAESTAVDEKESAGEINRNVLGIFFAVVGGCLVAFLFVAFVQGRKRRNNTAATETDVDHIGDVNVSDLENEKPKVTIGKWAAGLLSGKSNNDNSGSSPAAAVNDIDKVLADLHDSDDSSFVSAVSSGEDSGYSGMTGISDLNYQPKNKGTNVSKLAKVEEVKPSISFLDQSKGSLLRDTSLKRKEESFESDPSDSKGSSRTSQSMRKEESFESDYRDKSAMATLNLKKDMLNADVGEDEKARTMSAQQNSEMLAQQRQVDKVRAATVKAKKRMKSIGSSQKDGGQSVERDHLLPSPARKSDDLNFEIV